MSAKERPAGWETLARERLCATPIFDLCRYRRRHPGRGAHDFFVIEAPCWINIIPLTSDDRVVMIRQYRHGVEGFTLEIPGGMVDPGDSNPLAAARREMIEECGYDSNDIVELGRVHPNPAIQPNYCYSYLARRVKPVVRPGQMGAEETAPVTCALDEIRELIRTGVITHALVIAAFSFFHLYNPPAPD